VSITDSLEDAVAAGGSVTIVPTRRKRGMHVAGLHRHRASVYRQRIAQDIDDDVCTAAS
jgi:hypothetical protein